ncbi:hypothetical protein CLOM_g18578 [Closterium sp. NIES-68]|nr:hypothetical protein CLOM_g18578 [Closterium sp. NIES-68]GJP85676.1 hypothetical protein CLOP_g15791 [Closterium sp. NIES-67]
MDFEEFHLLPAEHLSKSQRWLAVASCNLATASLVFFLIRRLPKGLPRFLALSPIILLNIILPCVFSAAKRGECIEKGLVFWTVTWLGNFRLLALAWNRGSLTNPAYSASFFQFLVALYMPMQNRVRESPKAPAFSSQTPAQHSHHDTKNHQLQTQRQQQRRQHPASESSTQLLLRGSFKAFFLSLTIRAYSLSDLPPPAVTLLHSVNVFLFITFVCELVAGVVAAVVPRFAIEPHFRRPYLSTSLGSFWARRWNLVVSCSLRETVYEPALEWLGGRAVAERGEPAVKKRSHGKDSHFEGRNGYPATNGRHYAGEGDDYTVSDGFEAVEKINGSSEKVNGCSERTNGCYKRGNFKEEAGGYVNGAGRTWERSNGPCEVAEGFHKTAKQNESALLYAAAAEVSRSSHRLSFARGGATIAAFVVSGIMHELIAFYIGGAVTGEQMVFFSLHGVLTVAETWLRKEWRKRKLMPLPKVVAGGLALGVLLSTGHVFFFAPYQRLGTIGCVVVGLQGQFAQISKLWV